MKRSLYKTPVQNLMTERYSEPDGTLGPNSDPTRSPASTAKSLPIGHAVFLLSIPTNKQTNKCIPGGKFKRESQEAGASAGEQKDDLSVCLARGKANTRTAGKIETRSPRVITEGHFLKPNIAS